jgi:hypothetical protein
MKKYYLSKIYQEIDPPLNPWKHRLQDYPGVEYKGGSIKVDPATGAATEKAMLVLVGAVDHKPFQGDPDLIPMPDFPADGKVAGMHTPTKLSTKGRIVALGHRPEDVDSVWNNADGYRDVLNHYGRLNNPAFDVNDFDLTDF